MRRFQDDLKISWERLLCPYCKQPTGPCTNCEELGEPSYIQTSKNTSLPIYSTNCYFKSEQIWKVDMNYPISALMIQTILNENIRGLEKITATKSHSMMVTVAKLNDPNIIKQQITKICRNFIKTMQAKELDLLNKDYMPEGIIGIQFPNNNSYYFNPEDLDLEDILKQENYIKDLAKNYPDSKVVYRS